MPITLPCTCGKTFRIKDELSGKRVKCPACGGVLAVPAAPSAQEPVLEPLDDEPEAAGGPAETGPRAPARKKKKGKKRARARDREEVDAEFDRWRERAYWNKRFLRGSAFVVLGLVVICGAAYLLVRHSQDVLPLHSVLLLLIGVAA